MDDPTRLVTCEQVRHVAKLARLELSDEELALYTDQLDAVLSYVAQLAELPVQPVGGTAHAPPVDVACPLRDDDLERRAEDGRILSQAPDGDDGCFVVPRIIDG